MKHTTTSLLAYLDGRLAEGATLEQVIADIRAGHVQQLRVAGQQSAIDRAVQQISTLPPEKQARALRRIEQINARDRAAGTLPKTMPAIPAGGKG